MAKTPFKLRSGNTTPFKMMGSSPLHSEKWKELVSSDAAAQKMQSSQTITEKQPVGPIANPPTDYYMNPKVKPVVKSNPKPNVSVTNPNIVAKPVSTNVNMPNPNLEVGPPDDPTKVKDVFKALSLQAFINPNKTIRTFSKVKEKLTDVYKKGKTKITNVLNKTI